MIRFTFLLARPPQKWCQVLNTSMISGSTCCQCPITGSVNFDYLVKVTSARFLYCQITILLFLIKIYLTGDMGWGYVKIYNFLNIFLRFITFYLFYFYLLVWESERERNSVVTLNPAFIGWFLHVPWPGIKPQTLLSSWHFNQLSH